MESLSGYSLLKLLRSYLCFYDFRFQELSVLEFFKCIFLLFNGNKAILLKKSYFVKSIRVKYAIIRE